MGIYQDNSGLMFETDDKTDAEVEKHFAKMAAPEKRYTSNHDLRDMIADRDTYSLAETCDGDMWLTIRMTRLLPDYLVPSEIDDFLAAIQQAALVLREGNDK